MTYESEKKRLRELDREPTEAEFEALQDLQDLEANNAYDESINN